MNSLPVNFMSISMETSSEITVEENPKVTSENMENRDVVLPEEVITDIVSRLPVKPVFQLQCLSKNFSSITNDPCFINAHLGHSAHLRPSIILNKGPEIHLIRSIRLNSNITLEKVPLHKSINLTNSNKKFRIECSCNGLVVFSVDYHDCFIWNPATIQCNHLPNPTNVGHMSVRKSSWGFGYCTEIKQYKIVRIAIYVNVWFFLPEYDNSNSTEYVAEVFSCGIDCEWRRLNFSKFELMCDAPAITISGVVYWNSSCEQYNNKLLRFDLVKEEFAGILCPFSGWAKIMDFRGSLAACTLSGITRTTFDLWVLKDVTEYSWEKICTTTEFGPCMPVRFLNDRQLLLVEPGEEICELFSCSLCDLECEKVERIPQVLHHSDSGVVNYVESMVPLLLLGL